MDRLTTPECSSRFRLPVDDGRRALAKSRSKSFSRFQDYSDTQHLHKCIFSLSFHFLLPFLESGRFQSGRLLFRGNHLRQVERRPGLSVGQLEGVLSLPDGDHFPGGLRQNRIDTRVREDKSGRDFVSENDTQVYETSVRLLPKGEDSVRLSVVEREEKTRQ